MTQEIAQSTPDQSPVADPSNGKAKPHGNHVAMKGNASRVKHGSRGLLTLSRAPKGSEHTYRLISVFRRELTAALAKQHGALSLRQQGMILSACRAELCLKLYEAWARKSGRTEEDRLKAAEFAADMSERRDKIIEKLLGSDATGNGHSPADPLAGLHAMLDAMPSDEN
jgi:hypothetical protein